MQGRGGVRRAGGVAASLIAAFALASLGAPPAHARDEFEIAGEVDGLYPGAETTLDAVVTNPYPFAIRIMSTSAMVLDAGAACPASMLEVGDAQATVDVPAGATGIVPLPVRMDMSAPDACQGATWPLMFTGTAVRTDVGGLPGTNVLDPERQAALALIGSVLLVGGLLVARRRRRRPAA
jgi:LPXTG-motif cell wall-anchored protein